MPDFALVAEFQPTGDQPRAIERLSEGVLGGEKHQVPAARVIDASGTLDQTVRRATQALDGAFRARS